MRIALAHDYLTQRGGAERVLLSMLKAFPDAVLYTSLYLPQQTFPEFRRAEVRTLGLNSNPLLRRRHRLALPLLSAAFGRLRIEADTVICSTSGWAHGAQVSGRKIVYCHTPARWLYQKDRYLGPGRPGHRMLLMALRPHLIRWDQRAARSAHRYLAQSTTVRERIRHLYGIEAELLPAPYSVHPDGHWRSVADIQPGYVLCVSRLLPYKNVDAVIAAFADFPQQGLIVVGRGPEAKRLKAEAPRNVQFIDDASDEELRWLYGNAKAIVAASYEDYGLTPIEGAAFGKPAVVLRWGGFLDTVVEGHTGVFFDAPEPRIIRLAIERALIHSFDAAAIRAHAARYSEQRFISRLREIVDEELGVVRDRQPEAVRA